jgi:hypothetical protein
VTEYKVKNILESLDAVVGADGFGLIAAWRRECWLPPDQFEVHARKLIESGVVRLIPDEHAEVRDARVRSGGMSWCGRECNLVEKLK